MGHRLADPPSRLRMPYAVYEQLVKLDPTDRGFKRLTAELDHTTGIYWIEDSGLVLKIGQSGIKEGAQSGIGRRLVHHVTVAFNDVPSHRTGFPAWHAFMTALIGRTVTIRWMECSRAELRVTERLAIDGAVGGVLWERLKGGQNAAMKRDPALCESFSVKVAGIIDSHTETSLIAERE